MNTIKKLTLFFVLFLSFPGLAMALKCGNRIVDVGASKIKVISRCGEPDYKEIRERRSPLYCNRTEYGYNSYSYSKNQYFNNQSNCYIEMIDVWTYNFGPRQFMRELIFVRGVLKKINLLEYGY